MRGHRTIEFAEGSDHMLNEERIARYLRRLGLTVEIDDETWIVDVGLGDIPFEPLPLRAGTYPQHPFVYKVTKSAVSEAG